MPELPEVETVVRELRPHLLGRVILDAHVDWARIIAQPAEDIPRFRAGVSAHTIVGLTRRGKYVILGLHDARYVLFHLRMSGRLLLSALGQPQHLRIAFDLSDGGRLFFYCQRKFGRVWLVDDPDVVLGDLGPEPLSAAFTSDALRVLLRDRRAMLKPLLLNQRFVAGLGNIYVDESLFRAGLHPRRAANTLTAEEIVRLHDAIQSVLRQAIDHHGTTFDGMFVRPQGEAGRQQEGLSVYGQAGSPCPRCGTTVERSIVGGRGTHYCPQCQVMLPQGKLMRRSFAPDQDEGSRP
jgi:formamidopyrimidine-DNA glycosylase